MRVFRIEHITSRQGPYMCGKDIISGRSANNRPVPWQDGIDTRYDLHPDVYAKMRHGFKSLERLFSWFDEEHERRAMHDAGFVVALYDVPDTSVFCGTCQVKFIAAHAVLAEEITFNEAERRHHSGFDIPNCISDVPNVDIAVPSGADWRRSPYVAIPASSWVGYMREDGPAASVDWQEVAY